MQALGVYSDCFEGTHYRHGAAQYLPDAFGWQLHNTRALADAYARQVPCTIYIPEFLNESKPLVNQPPLPPPTRGHAVFESVLDELEKKPAPSLLAKVSRTLTTLSLLPAYHSSLYHTRQAVAHPHVQAFLRGLRADQQPSLNATGATKIGVATFCCGGGGGCTPCH
ncbi:uncharacterized protein B0T15DRAFT_505653 [Chaetomium strumarium]|uniref:Uncharacterized protein n=1 Tax=Chaetomium strumarium TaxID=1170767 RepID=A0AAJ0LYR3_9PEZI|nr:hypothetical protein B0T15DRAFT_505653 [Chaetomium strumarium]